MQQLKVALDWTINTNHTGFIIAAALGFYKDVAIDVSFQLPSDDNYAITPAKKVELQLADVALCPFESVISYRTKKQPFNAIAIATIFKEDVSSVVVLKDSGITSPKQLVGKKYASYKAKYEDMIVQQMVNNDGGEGAVEIIYPDKLGIWDTLLAHKAAATWIFDNWEGVAAATEGIATTHFKLGDYGIPYGYSPVLLVNEYVAFANEHTYKNFLQATKKGYLYAANHVDEAVAILKKHVPPPYNTEDFLRASQLYSNKYYGNEQNWGIMEPDKVTAYLQWMQTQQIEQQMPPMNHLFTNTFL